MLNKTLLAGTTMLLAVSGFAVADQYPSFSEADSNSDGELSVGELTAVVPQIELQTTSDVLTTADVKRVMPEIEFDDIDVVNATPVGEDQYLKIVESIEKTNASESVSSI